MRRRKPSEKKVNEDGSVIPTSSTDDRLHEHKHDDPANDPDFSPSHLAPDAPSSAVPSSTSVSRRQRHRSGSRDSNELEVIDDDDADPSQPPLDRRRRSRLSSAAGGGTSSLEPPGGDARHYMLPSSDDDFDPDDEDDNIDPYAKMDFTDLEIEAMNAKLVIFMIFLFGMFALIFFTQGSSFAIGYLFIILPLCPVGIYGAFTFSPTALKVFWIGLLLWTLMCAVTFVGLVFTGSLEDIAKERCALESFRQIIEDFNEGDLLCENEVETQLLWEGTGTAVALVLMLLWCSHSIRKFQKKVRQKWDMEEFNDHSLK